MKCPQCGKDMTRGELTSCKGEQRLFFAPKSFFDKHYMGGWPWRRKTIEQEGGIFLQTHSVLHEASAAYACAACGWSW